MCGKTNRFSRFFREGVACWKESGWTGADALISAALFIPSVAAYACGSGGSGEIPDAGALAISLIALPLAVAFFTLHRAYTARTGIKALLGFRKENALRDTLTGILLAFALMPLLAAVSMMSFSLMSHAGLEPQEQSIMQWLSAPESPRLSVWMLIIHAVILAPLSEEILWRRIILSGALRVMRPAPAVIAVSAAFAIVHCSPALVPPLFILGTAFAASALFSRSITVSAAFHVMFNVLNIIVLLVLQHG